MSGQVFHAPFISTNPHFELTAVTERSKELSRAKYPQSRIVRSFDELIGMEELELVVVNTPDSSHYEYAHRALEAGKHLMKPARMPEVKITLKASYLMCENEPRFVLHGTEGSYVKYGLDPQEADLTKGMLPDTPHWGEEDESQWGILHTETDGNVVRKPYPTLPGNYAAFYENIYQHIRNGAVLQSDACGVLGVIRLIEAAWESSRTGNVIKL